MKQLISWNDETKTISVIGVFSEKDICGAVREYVKKRITSLYGVTEKEAQDMIEKGGCAGFDDGRMAAQIVIPGNGYREYLQAADIPCAACIAEDDHPARKETEQKYSGAELIAYTDGSYNKDTGEFGAGIVMFEKSGGDPRLLYGERPGRRRRERMAGKRRDRRCKEGDPESCKRRRKKH